MDGGLETSFAGDEDPGTEENLETPTLQTKKPVRFCGIRSIPGYINILRGGGKKGPALKGLTFAKNLPYLG